MRLPFQLPEPTSPDREQCLNDAHELAIARAISDRPGLAGCAGWNVDSIVLLSHQPDGDRAYSVTVTGWWDDGDTWELSWEVQTGEVEGRIQALYWLAM